MPRRSAGFATRSRSSSARRPPGANRSALHGVPFSIAVVAWTVRETARGSTNPAIRFFLVSAAVTLLAYVGWIALEGWPFAEPCAVIGC